MSGSTMRYGEVVRRALEWLVSEHESGDFAPTSPDELRGRALAALALSEAYGITNAVAYRAPAQRAALLLQADMGGLGWTDPRSGEGAVAASFALLALESAKRACLDGIDEGVLARARAKLADYGLSRSLPRIIDARPKAAAEGLLGWVRQPVWERWDADLTGDAREALIAQALLCETKRDAAREPTEWFLASAAFYGLDGPTGPNWRKWSVAAAKTLNGQQHARGPSPRGGPALDGCAYGSWEETASGADRARGRPYATAMNVLALEIYYRYLSVVVTRRD